MKEQTHGCGKDDAPLTLYRFSADGVPTPVGDNFWHVRCGYCPPTRGSKPRGILLCGACASELGFPAMLSPHTSCS